MWQFGDDFLGYFWGYFGGYGAIFEVIFGAVLGVLVWFWCFLGNFVVIFGAILRWSWDSFCDNFGGYWGDLGGFWGCQCQFCSDFLWFWSDLVWFWGKGLCNTSDVRKTITMFWDEVQRLHDTFSSSKRMLSWLWLWMSFCWTFAIWYLLRQAWCSRCSILCLRWSRQNWKPSSGIQLCHFTACILHTTTLCCAQFFLSLSVHSYLICFRASKLSMYLWLSEMWQERSPCWVSRSVSKAFNRAPQSEWQKGDMKYMFLSGHIFFCGRLSMSLVLVKL